MPHTNRKKKPPSSSASKRTQITDETGWTHVTTTGNAHRARRQHHPPQPSDTPTPPPKINNNSNSNSNNTKNTEIPNPNPLLQPAEAPKSLTLPALQTQYRAHFEKWIASETAATLRGTVRREVAQQREGQPDTTSSSGSTLSHRQGTPRITNIICIGLGSPSGFLRGGWVDRRSVSLYQLCALMSVVECFAPNTTAQDATTTTPTPTQKPEQEHEPIPGKAPLPIYAQDPVFNELDRSLLTTLGITVVEHPTGFEKVEAGGSLLFCPGAEKTHLELLLAQKPACVVGGPLEETMESSSSGDIARFVTATESVRLPRFEEMKEAFWGMRVYYPRTDDHDHGVEE
ncbi:SRR1 family protein [Aspergillus homomorphus CBS 101889]|uniref:SRR1-like domain-containing protein n=1 Tax=Aspergillus homomorphus (strain CBS 101889) TaxID=1450537 RepID=A0A395HQR2_ASPHC|nr:hypothetical protein BO97DRAFT_480537 [Aspergillus homomorphus CBS 101889]RAL08594.1 hypothetical protein BO97DRAFT_480537 [Aspergillus homomorphus CBS 101889]